MRLFSRLMCALAIAAAPAAVNAAPRTIDDCESIQAPDAYNQCLALFGPIARGHAKTANVEEPGAAAGKTNAEPGARDADVQTPDRSVAHAQGREKRRRGFSRSGGHRHRAAVAHHSRGGKSMRFSVVSGRTHLR